MNAFQESFMTIPSDAHFLSWAPDAQLLLKGGHATRDRNWIRKLYLVPTSGIAGYEAGSFVVAGPRGSGKSALVARRAVRMLDEKEQNNVLLKKNSPFVNELPASTIKISIEQLRQLTSTRRWTAIWQCVLSAHFAFMVYRERRQAKNDDDMDLDLLLNKAAKKIGKTLNGNTKLDAIGFLSFVNTFASNSHGESIGKSIDRLISSGNDNSTLEGWSEIFLYIVGSSQSDSVYSIHVDAIDEAIILVQEDDSENGRLLGHDEKDATLAWVASQKGFLISCGLVDRAVSNARVYGSVRIEAVQTLSEDDLIAMGTTHSKSADSMLSKIQYTASELREVFKLNVLKSEPGYLAREDLRDQDPEMCLFGFKKIRHSTVYGFDEAILDLVCRHTFGTPRDLVFLVKNVLDATPLPKERPTDTESWLTAIDHSAHELCKDWLSNVMPSVSAQLRQAILGIDRNVITLEDQDRIENNRRAPGLFAQLFSRGMFGIPTKSMTDGSYYMKFHAPDGGEHELPPDFTYGALHPALSAHICKTHPNKSEILDFYSNVFVVGDGLPCPKEISDPKLSLLIKDGNLKLTTNFNGKTRTFSLNDTTLFMPEATPSRRHIAAELLCTLILCVSRKKLSPSIGREDLLSEESYAHNIGLLRSPWGKFNFEAYINGHLFGQTKFEMFSEINKVTGPAVGLKIRQSDTSIHSESIDAISLCWGENHHAQSWVPVQPNEIEVTVSQNRKVIEPN